MQKQADNSVNDELIYSLIHSDLANPLQSVLATLELIEYQQDSGNSLDKNKSNEVRPQQIQPNEIEELKTSLEKITETTLNLRELALHKFPGRARLKQKIDLAQITQNLVSQFTAVANQHEVDIVYEGEIDSVFIMQQTSTVERIVSCVVGNAIKCCAQSDGARVVVSIAAVGRHAVIEVTDNGPGISAAQLKDLGKAPQKPTALNLETHGSGLGLFLTRRLVEQQSGNIAFESLDGKGTKVTIKLPRLKS